VSATMAQLLLQVLPGFRRVAAVLHSFDEMFMARCHRYAYVCLVFY